MSVNLTHAKIIQRVQTSFVTSCAHVNLVTLESNVRPILMSVKINLASTMAHVMTSLITTHAHAHKVTKGLTAMMTLMSVFHRRAPKM